MRLTLPLTGTVLVEGSLTDGFLTGDPNDPIRPISLDLGNVSWEIVSVDLEKEVMVIEVEPGEMVSEPNPDAHGKQKIDPDTEEPMWISREAIEEEKTKFLQDTQKLIETHTKDELYQMSGCPRLKRPFKGKK